MPRKTSTPTPHLLSEQEKTSAFSIEWWDISRPKPYAKNARKISDRAVAKVAASLKEFGWRQHQVDYRPFKTNKFIPVPGLEVSEDPNNYGMELIKHVK